MHIKREILLEKFSIDLIYFVNLSTTIFIQRFLTFFIFFIKTRFLTFFILGVIHFLHLLNKLQLYCRISALGLEGHCTSHFKRAMCITGTCRLHVDLHKGEGVWLMWTHVDREVKNLISLWQRKRMAPNPAIGVPLTFFYNSIF